jgi:hypothetical protein
MIVYYTDHYHGISYWYTAEKQLAAFTPVVRSLFFSMNVEQILFLTHKGRTLIYEKDLL